MLLGRSNECAALDRLLDGARGGQSGVLVLQGEPGVGKTALLEYAVHAASGFRVTRAFGAEGRVVDDISALPEALGAAIASQAPTVLAVPMDRLPSPF